MLDKKINFYNTLTQKKQEFQPLDKHNVRMYVCGPTVYDYAHIGNARPVVTFDMVFRLLRLVYGEDHVVYARNITDVDDKIIARAKDRNISIAQLTAETEAWFQNDMDKLGALRPTYQPKATEHIAEMQHMIRNLIEKGHAYHAEGHVLFDVASMPEYGKLSKRNLDDMIAGARVEVAPYKKNPMDFVLWKPSAPDMQGWDSDWGWGRPGWHIECSAMSLKWLGETFDIHGGGLDLIFPHHENEIAQSCCSSGKDFVTTWMHNGFVQVEGQKMSKSLGNFLTVHDLLDEKGIDGEVIRLTLLRTHYRQPLDWTQKTVDESKAILDKWYRAVQSVDVSHDVAVHADILDALCDDLNTPLAITHLHNLPAGDLLVSARFLGLLAKTPQQWFQAGVSISAEDIEKLIADRKQAKQDRNFALADSIRKQLLDVNIILEDKPDGTVWRRG